ncbi:MAG TPA: hypothetical protein VIA62_11380 [Thermoanaerobaculia bacterium]|jgi:hypothetical protein|nr:hypothetical protein [Thermoanaerobaculia bacterium]
MSPLIFFTVWMLARPQAGTTPSPAHGQNVVRICSLASGGSLTGCQDLDARLLERAAVAPAAGQRAFVDPETKSLVEPNQDQLKELSVILSESMDKRQDEPKVQVLPNGTLRLPGGSFTLYSRATIEKKGEKP